MFLLQVLYSFRLSKGYLMTSFVVSMTYLPAHANDPNQVEHAEDLPLRESHTAIQKEQEHDCDLFNNSIIRINIYLLSLIYYENCNIICNLILRHLLMCYFI